jgi:uncharacterized protein (UPF0332 family)
METAQVDLAAAKWRGAVIRAYYTVFHIASAVLLWHDQERAKHSGVHSAFGEWLIRPGKVESEYGKIYTEARRMREASEYDFEGEPITEANARRIVADAERFVARMTEYLREAGALEEGS